MEGGRQASYIAHGTRNAFGPAGEYFPLGWAEAHLSRNAPGVLRAHGVAAVGIGENEQRALRLCSFSPMPTAATPCARSTASLPLASARMSNGRCASALLSVTA